MFHIGDFIIYGNSGFCQIKSIGSPNIPSADKAKQYYTLSPIYSTEIIYTPIDTNVFMRPVITREEAKQLIEQIPASKENVFDSRNIKILSDYYEASLQTHDCKDLLQLIKTIYIKNISTIQSGKKMSQTDHRYLKRAEELLYSEFAVVFGLTIDDVRQYIENAVTELISVQNLTNTEC